MSRAQLLQQLAGEVRRDTLKILAAVEEDLATWSPPATSNHILWHAGHAGWLQDLMCVAPLTEGSELPDGWATIFGMDSQPSQVPKWPLKQEIQRFLEGQLDRIVQLLDKVSEEVLSGPAWGLGRHRNLLGWIVHGLHDEAKHSGEMYLLFKMTRSAGQTR